MDPQPLPESATFDLTALEADPEAAREAAGEDMRHPAEAPAPRIGGGHGEDLAATDLDELIRAALEGLTDEMPSAEISPTTAPGPTHVEPVEAITQDNAAYDHASQGAPRELSSPADWAQDDPARQEPLETVELELALHNQNVVSLGFEESIRTALAGLGGEILFEMRVENEDCQRIAAVRVGQGENRQFALVILPPGGGLMRVEPVSESTNPLARITESYAGLMDVFRAAA
jgi:hypothetical protein